MTHAGNVFAAGCILEYHQTQKNCQSICHVHNSSSRGVIVTWENPVLLACVVGHCSRKNQAWLTYAASGNVVTCDLDLLIPK